jgi:hypothetical protein
LATISSNAISAPPSMIRTRNRCGNFFNTAVYQSIKAS